MAEKTEISSKDYSIFKILSEEGELLTYNELLDLPNIISMRKAKDFVKENLISEDGDLFLTVDSLITLNNMITDSNNLNLRTCEVKPAGYDKYYMHSTHIERALYSLVDSFNERKITASTFAGNFLIVFIPLKMEMVERVKFYLKTKLKTLMKFI